MDGEIIKGLVEESDIERAYDNVSSTGLYILKIKKTSNLARFYLNKIKSRGIKTQDIIEFANNLSVMLKAGLPLLTSLEDISQTIENKNLRSRIVNIKKMIEMGSSFASALILHKDIFPEIFINLVSVGEETGRLDRSLSDIVVHLQRMEDLKSAIKRALIYPVFAIIATTGTLLFWLIYVLPKIVELFESLAVHLPLMTRILLSVSGFSRSNWYLFILIPLVVFISIKLLSKREATRYYIDLAKLRLPVVKHVVFNKVLALFAEQFRILFAAGLTIDRSFDIMIKLIDNAVYKRAISDIKEEILLGSRIHEAIERHGRLFPNIVSRLIFVGEESGNLTEQLNYLSEEFLKRLDDISQKIGKIIEPVVIVIIGIFFMVIIAGLLLPVYDLITAVGTR
jgi:type II secretory pathway component PulF